MKVKFDKNENDILTSFENDEWVEVPNMTDKIKKHVKYAEATLRKDKR